MPVADLGTYTLLQEEFFAFQWKANKYSSIIFLPRRFGSSSAFTFLRVVDHANIHFGNPGHFLVNLNTFYGCSIHVFFNFREFFTGNFQTIEKNYINDSK